MVSKDFWKRLSSIGMFGSRPGVEIMSDLLSEYDHPEKDFEIIHVAGTNGKGSTARYIADLLKASGHRTGLYTSPHLVSPTERICVDGTPVSEEAFAEIADDFMANKEATVSDIILLTALFWFKKNNCRYIVIETGLGGRMDSTNALTGDGGERAARVCVITRIGLDHTQILGSTLSEIAGEKAGIIKPESSVVLAEMPDEAVGVIEGRCKECGVTCERAADHPEIDEWIRENYPGLYVTYQRENLKNAVLAVRALGEEIVPRWIPVSIPGRLQVLTGNGKNGQNPANLWDLGYNVDIIADGAHNPQGAFALAKSLENLYPGEKFDCLIGIVSDKDAPGIIEPVIPIMGSAIITSAGKGERFSDGRTWGKLIEQQGIGVEYVPTAEDAYDRLKNMNPGGKKLVFGSLYLIGDVIGL